MSTMIPILVLMSLFSEMVILSRSTSESLSFSWLTHCTRALRLMKTSLACIFGSVPWS